MGLNVKDVSTSATKFVQRAQNAAPDYQKGVQGAGGYWQTQAAASQDAYSQGVTAAITANRYSKGINTAGGQKYETNAAGKGAQRYPQGVAQAGPAWQNGFQKYATVLSSLNLPARSARGNPANSQRAAAVATALHNAKMGS